MAGDGARPLSHNLVLIGGRGCGKSSVARRIARRERRFQLYSLDGLVRYEAGGGAIPELVEERGWEGFRALEREVVRKVSAFRGGALVDCGGGVVVDLDADGREVYSEEKVEALRRHGLVVYLYRDPRALLERVRDDPQRPPLSDSRSFLEIMAQRDPWYRRAADRVLECEELSKREIADRILAWFRARVGEPESGAPVSPAAG